MDDYDVIIVGTGAGGGTLARHLAPSGKRILLLERGDWLPREPQNWLAAGRVRRQPLRLARHLVRRERQAVPAADPLLRRRRDQALRRRALPAARGGLRRAPAPRRHLARLADLLRRARAVLHARPSSCTRCTATAARTRPSAPASAPYPFPAVSHEPRIQQLSDASRQPATTRSTRRAASCSTRRTWPYSACVRCTNCDGFPCLVHGKSDAEVLGVRPALEHPNVTLLTNAQASSSRRTRPARRSRRSSSSATARPSATPPTSSCSRAAPRTPRSCSCSRRTTGTRTASRTAPTRSGGTTCSTTARPCSRCRARRTRPSSRRRSGSTTSTSAATTTSTRSGTSRWSASRRRRCSAARSRARRSSRRSWTLERVAQHAIDFWLSTEDLPRPDNRVTVDRDGKVTLALHGDERRAEGAALREAQVDARQARHEPGPPDLTASRT